MTSLLQQVKDNCQCFIAEFGNSPLYRAFNRQNPDIFRVKVRHRKPTDSVWEQCFNTYFSEQFTDIRKRAVFAYPTPPPETESFEPYFIFPIDGYSFTYSPTVHDSHLQYEELFAFMNKNFEHDTARKLFIDNLEHSYKNDSPQLAIESNSEILLFGISHYFAIRAKAFHYNDLILHLSV